MNAKHEIVVKVPFIPIAIYCEMQNIPINTGYDMVHDNRLPIQKKTNLKDKVMIDMVALALKNAPPNTIVVVDPSAAMEVAKHEIARKKTEKKHQKLEKQQAKQLNNQPCSATLA